MMTRTLRLLTAHLGLAVLTCVACLASLAWTAPAHADAQTAKWWAEEQKCIAKCPKLPRFSGTESDKQFKERIKKTDAYNRCQRQCVTDYMNRVQIKHEPFDDGSEGYFKRNE